MGACCEGEAEKPSGYTSNITAARRDRTKRDKFAKADDGGENSEATRAPKSPASVEEKPLEGHMMPGGLKPSATASTDESKMSDKDRYKKYRDTAEEAEGAHESYQSALHDTEYESMIARRRASDNSDTTSDAVASAESSGIAAGGSSRDSADGTGGVASDSPNKEKQQQQPQGPVVAGFISLVGGVPHVVPDSPTGGDGM